MPFIDLFFNVFLLGEDTLLPYMTFVMTMKYHVEPFWMLASLPSLSFDHTSCQFGYIYILEIWNYE